MAREKNNYNRAHLLIAVVVLLVVAAYALWQGKQDVSESRETDAIGVIDESVTTQQAPPPNESSDNQDTTESTAETPAKQSRPSFISQEGLASIPAERFFTTTAMNGLTPGTPVSSFRSGDAVYIYAGINAPRAERIQLQWFGPDGKLVLPSIYKNISANTGAVGYRIYTYRIFRVPGQYQVKLYNSAGTVIGSSSFEVVQSE